MSQREDLYCDFASLLVGELFDEGFEGSAVVHARKKLVAINEAPERHRLFAQGMGDAVVVHDLVVPPRQRSHVPGATSSGRTSDKDIPPIIEQAPLDD